MGESISFGFDGVTNDIFSNVGGVTIDITAPNPNDSFSEFRSTSCPGPWTIGTQAVIGFTLDGYIYEDEFGEVSTEVIGDGNFFGFQATTGWDPASGVGTIGTANGKGFEGLCELLLGRPFDFDEIECSCDASCTEFTCGDEALDCAGCEFCEEICDGFCSKFTCDAPQCRDCALCENRCDNFCNEFTCAAVAQCGNCEICQSPQPSSSPSKSAKKSKKAKKNK